MYLSMTKKIYIKVHLHTKTTEYSFHIEQEHSLCQTIHKTPNSLVLCRYSLFCDEDNECC